jgi:hypothetical protein
MNCPHVDTSQNESYIGAGRHNEKVFKYEKNRFFIGNRNGL